MEVVFDYGEVLEYIDKIYRDSDYPRMNEFIEKSGVEDFDPTIEDDIARVFRLLMTLTRPKKVLEIGMSIGFSTTILALAVKDFGGKVTSLELDPDIAEVAKKNFERIGIQDTIEVKIGDASNLLKEIPDESFDVVFQDSSKRLYPVMLEDCLRVLKKGGIFLIDDTLFPVMTPEDDWSESDRAIDEFNRDLLKYDVESVLLPIGEGLTVVVKK